MIVVVMTLKYNDTTVNRRMEPQMTRATAIPTAANRQATKIKPDLLRLIDILPPARQAEILDFARFLHQQDVGAGSTTVISPLPIKLRAAPAATLMPLTGLVALGGDAVADSESLYDADVDRN